MASNASGVNRTTPIQSRTASLSSSTSTEPLGACESGDAEVCEWCTGGAVAVTGDDEVGLCVDKGKCDSGGGAVTDDCGDGNSGSGGDGGGGGGGDGGGGGGSGDGGGSGGGGDWPCLGSGGARDDRGRAITGGGEGEGGGGDHEAGRWREDLIGSTALPEQVQVGPFRRTSSPTPGAGSTKRWK